MTDIIPPEILRGTRDFLPAQMAKRQYVTEKFKQVFRTFGYDAIETPAIEYAKTILGKYGDEGNKLTYTFTDKGDRNIALRYDQTVPFARLVAANYKELPMPFKRYDINRVWRADRPAKGRYREFYQCDIDIIGTKSLVADAEIATVISAALKELGFKKFVIKCNSRRLVNSILESLHVAEENFIPILRILDKIEKIGRDTVAKELSEIIGSEVTNKLLNVTLMSGTTAEKIAAVQKYNAQEITEFFEVCKGFGIPDEHLEFDLSLARGLDYYTGIIFEAVLPDIQIGSVVGGGRYDNLCGMFCKEEFSGVGVAFGFDRIIDALEELNLLQDIGLSTHILVTNFESATLPFSLQVTRNLRQAGIATEIYMESASLKKQLKYANKKDIPFVVFCGSQEQEKNEVKIKNMSNGEENNISVSQLASYFTELSQKCIV